jgi:hypothetical protein
MGVKLVDWRDQEIGSALCNSRHFHRRCDHVAVFVHDHGREHEVFLSKLETIQSFSITGGLDHRDTDL